MKLNNKGFAISVILYSMIILTIGVLYLLLGVLNTRYNLSKETSDDVVDYINNQGVNTITDDRASKIATTRIINTGNLLQKNGNYYYYGNNPNNYIRFNNEEWRIIGVISINKVKYLKLIRNNYLKVASMDNYKVIESNIFEYLNNEYYPAMKDKNMVKDVYWNNAEYSTSITALNAYNKEITTSLNSKQYVGLIDGSDFGYTAGEAYLTKNLSSYNSSTSNWLSFSNNYFTMSYYGNNINIVSNGNLVNTTSKNAYIYPCVYIKKDIFIIGGVGTSSDPYILSIS